jgi:DNA-binding transcriptional LysR family regulator
MEEAMSQIDLRLIRAAVTVAEELSFSRAAVKLHVSQPALTKQIQDLEATLGVPLFIRDRQRVHMTDAGRAFVEESKLALIHQERAVAVARSTAKGVETILNLGQSPFVDPFLSSIVTSVHLPLFPELRINVSCDYAPELLRRVASGELEIALLTAGPELPQLTQVEVAISPLYVLISETSALTVKRTLGLQDLDEIPWILFARQVHPTLYDAIHERAMSLGIVATERHHVISAELAAQLVFRTGGAAILNKHGAWRMAMDGLTMRPLDEPEIVMRTVLAVRNDASRLVSELVRATVRKLKSLSAPSQGTLPLTV